MDKIKYISDNSEAVYALKNIYGIDVNHSDEMSLYEISVEFIRNLYKSKVALGYSAEYQHILKVDNNISYRITIVGFEVNRKCHLNIKVEKMDKRYLNRYRYFGEFHSEAVVGDNCGEYELKCFVADALFMVFVEDMAIYALDKDFRCCDDAEEKEIAYLCIIERQEKMMAVCA